MSTDTLPKTTLVLLQKPDYVLLAMKKRRFGEGKWNGVGGKPEKGETIEQAAIRECEEEIHIQPLKLSHMATLDFYHDAQPDWNQQVIVFSVTEWTGEPTETEEMKPQWFALSEIPYESMWDDDAFWLPEFLAGKKLHWTFRYDLDQKIIEHRAESVVGK